MTDTQIPKTEDPETLHGTFTVNGMDCASCVAHVSKAIAKVPGVKDVAVNLALGRAAVTYDADTPPAAIAAAATEAGYPTQPATEQSTKDHHDHQAEHAADWLRRGVLGVVLWLPVELLHWLTPRHAMTNGSGMLMWVDWLSLVASTLAIVLIGGGFYASAFAAARRRTSNMDTLIALGATVAYGYSLIALIGHLLAAWPLPPALYFNEATALLALISVGHWLEARARTKAGSAIRDLMHLAPSTALKVPAPAKRSLTVLNSTPAPAGPDEVPVVTLVINDHVLIRPGDRVPVDGEVVSGVSTVDESMLTGESVPVKRQPGDAVTGGTQNLDGALTVRVTRVGSETALAQIVKLVETAQNSRPPVQKLADQIAAIFVPTVLAIALITGIGWYGHGRFSGHVGSALWAPIAQAVCGVLIVACPCALGLAVPAALMVGTGRGSKLGILFRDIDALQSAESITTVLLDKTGTITRGRPAVTNVVTADGITRAELLRLAASAERGSSHPLAKAVVDLAAAEGIIAVEPTAFLNEPGSGIHATVDGDELLVGNAEMLKAAGITAEGAATATTIWIGRLRDRLALGRIDLADEIKTDSRAAISTMHAMGLRTVLLTGDHHVAAQAVASAVGINDVRAGVKPDGKADAVRGLRAGGKIAMVGDGINDAPALAAADLGIAIGTGSDIAKETGGIVLVSGSLAGVPTAISLSKATMRVIRQNLFFAFLYNTIAIPLAAFGLLSPIICAAAMALSDVTVIGNALLLMRKKLK